MSIAIIVLVAALVALSAALLGLLTRVDTLRLDLVDSERDFAKRLAAKENDRSALRTILDGLGEGLLALDRKRHVVLANRRFIEMFKISGDVIGRPLGEVIRIASVFNAFDAALGGAESTERFTLGIAERRFEIRAIPITAEQIAAVALFIDVTRLESLEQVRRDFISDFTHEVRTPL